MQLNIESFTKAGSLEFGANREKVREILGTDFTVFKKSPLSKNTTDDYSNIGLHLYYSEDDRLEFIEMFPPADPIFHGNNLLIGNATDILDILTEYDDDPEMDGASYIFHKIGIAIYIEDEIEAVSAFARDYYKK